MVVQKQVLDDIRRERWTRTVHQMLDTKYGIYLRLKLLQDEMTRDIWIRRFGEQHHHVLYIQKMKMK